MAPKHARTYVPNFWMHPNFLGGRAPACFFFGTKKFKRFFALNSAAKASQRLKLRLQGQFDVLITMDMALRPQETQKVGKIMKNL